MNTIEITQPDTLISLDVGLGVPYAAGALLGAYGSFYDSTSQPIAVINTPQPIDIGETLENNRIDRQNGGEIVFETEGTYSLTFSLQFANTDNTPATANVWVEYNGETFPDSNTRFDVPARKSASLPGHLVGTVNYVASSTDGGIVRIMWAGSTTGLKLEAIAAAGTVPNTPSVILTVTQVMFTQIGPQGPQGEVGDVNPEMYVILGDAEQARDDAQIAAGTATTQAGIATTQAGISTTQAGISLTQAGIATTKASEALASANAASLSESNADADAIQTAADRVQTGLDVVATGADRIQTGLDAVATAADRVQTGLDVIATAADRVQTGLDAIATAADRVQTGLDAIATAADRVQTGLDSVATAADRVQTGLDADATAADRVQTGLDADSAAASAQEAYTVSRAYVNLVLMGF
jgi:hypothetical protein